MILFLAKEELPEENHCNFLFVQFLVFIFGIFNFYENIFIVRSVSILIIIKRMRSSQN